MTEGISVRRQTQQEIVDYIQRHSSNGRLKRSLMDIARQIGYSNATVHRTMRKLEDDGVVRIIPGTRPTEPNTIIYLGSNISDSHEILIQGTRIARKMEEASNEMIEFIESLSKKMKQSEIDLQAYYKLQSRLIDIVNLPDEKYQMMILTKDDHKT